VPVLDSNLVDLDSKIPEENIPVHVVNLDIQDNHEEATIGAFMICELVNIVSLFLKLYFPKYLITQID